MKFILDPGHGGHDPGTVDPFTGMPEKTAAFLTALTLKHLLVSAGHEVVMTRASDVRPAYSYRTQSQGADLLVSIHYDWEKGRSLLYYGTQQASLPLGSAIAQDMGIPLWATSRSPHGGLYIDRYEEGPALLWEVDTITNFKPYVDYRIQKTTAFMRALFRATKANASQSGLGNYGASLLGDSVVNAK